MIAKFLMVSGNKHIERSVAPNCEEVWVVEFDLEA